MRAALAVLLLAAGLAGAAPAQELRPFVAGSYAQIQHEQADRPFVLALWSLDCPPCHDELALLGRVLKRDSRFKLVLVSTDSPASSRALQETLRRHGLERAQAWVFADDYVEKLRFEIDRAWRGELPRTYFVHADGSARAHSGKVDASMLEAWLAGHGR
jgi:hypothetical protein